MRHQHPACIRCHTIIVRRLIALLLAIPTIAFAAPFDPMSTPNLIPQNGVMVINGQVVPNCNFLNGDLHYHCVPIYVAYLIRLLFGLMGTICLFMIIWAGFEWAFSGLQNDTQAPKTRIRNAIMGLVLCTLSYLLVDTVISALFA